MPIAQRVIEERLSVRQRPTIITRFTVVITAFIMVLVSGAKRIRLWQDRQAAHA